MHESHIVVAIVVVCVFGVSLFIGLKKCQPITIYTVFRNRISFRCVVVVFYCVFVVFNLIV